MQNYYQREDITLFHGDCIKILNSANTETIDMIFADPSYMLSNGGITCQAGNLSLLSRIITMENLVI